MRAEHGLARDPLSAFSSVIPHPEARVACLTGRVQGEFGAPIASCWEIAFNSSILADKRARGEQDINREMIRSYQGDNRGRKSKTSGAKTAPDSTKIAPEAA